MRVYNILTVLVVVVVLNTGKITTWICTVIEKMVSIDSTVSGS